MRAYRFNRTVVAIALATALATALAVGFAVAQNSWTTPGGSQANGSVVMQLNGSGQPVPVSSTNPLATSGGGGGGGSVTQGTVPWVVDETTASQFHADLTSAVPCLVATTSTTNSYSNGTTSPVNCNLNGALYTALAPATSGGLTTFFLQPAATTNSTSVKASAGQVYWILAENNSATVNYLRLYNSAGAPTCSSATGLITQVQIPASTAVGGVTVALPYGIPFSSGIGICVTSGYATTDTNNATATAISLTIGYQ